MSRSKYTVTISPAFYLLLLVWPLLCVCQPRAHAQEIRVKVLNGHNGKPITKECLNIWVGTLAGPHLLAATNRNGVVVLWVSADKLVAESACPGWPVQAARPTGSENILVTGDYYVACQEYAKVVPNAAKPKFIGKIPPVYSIAEILASGMASGNTCGKFRAKPQPGELIFFVRPRTFWEKMKE